jgi:septal ring factor EnvC (AmiA/AmiB activator)
MRAYSISRLLCLLFFVSFSGVLFAQKDKKDELEEKKKKLQQEMANLNKMLAKTTNNKEITLNELIMLNKKISVREDIIATMNNEIEIMQSQIDEGNDSIGEMEVKLDDLKKEYARMIYEAYKNQSSSNRLMFIFASKDFEQAIMRMRYLQEYSSYRHRQAIMIDSAKKTLNRQVDDLQKKKDEKKELLASEQSEKEELTKEKAEQQKVFAKLQGKEKELRKQIAEKQKAAKKLDEAIHKIIEDEIKRSNAKTHTTGSKSHEISLTPEAKALSKTFESNKGSLPWPVVEGIIFKQFGSYSPMPGIEVTNNGIDIATTKGAVARAVFQGVVTGIAEVPSSGKVVIIRHGEYLTVYSNLKEVFVKTGDNVTTKQTLGTILFDGEDGKTELHLEIWKGSIKLNPEDWLFKKS